MGFDSNHIAQYLFENNANDSSGNGYNLNPSGSATYSTTTVHDGTYSWDVIQPAYFTFSGSVVTALAAATSYTFELWVYVDNAVSSNLEIFYIASKLLLRLNYSTGKFELSWNGGAANACDFDTSTEKGTWINLAFVYDGVADTCKFYKNNSNTYTKTTAGTIFAGAETCFVGVGSTVWWNGFWDNWIVSDVVRTSFPSYADTGVYRVLNNDGMFSTSKQNKILR